MTTRQTAFRLTDEDFAILDEVQSSVGFVSRSDALRYVLRQHAKAQGFDVPKPKTRAKGPYSSGQP